MDFKATSETITTSAAPRRSRRARILLLLFALSWLSAGQTLGELESLPEKLGALLIPFGLLSAGCWFAFRDGGRGTRICAAFLALATIGSFGYGVIQGRYRQAAARELNGELDKIQAGLTADASDSDLGTDASRRHTDRTREALARLQSSENSETATLARVIQEMLDLQQATELRLLAALDGIGTERFLRFPTALANDDFDWQRSTVAEYAAAAKATVENHGRLPTALAEKLTAAKIPAPAFTAILTGFRRTWTLSDRVYEAHVDCAASYSALIEFVESHRGGITVLDDGSLQFEDQETLNAYNALWGRAVSADETVTAAVDELTRALTKG